MCLANKSVTAILLATLYVSFHWHLLFLRLCSSYCQHLWFHMCCIQSRQLGKEVTSPYSVNRKNTNKHASHSWQHTECTGFSFLEYHILLIYFYTRDLWLIHLWFSSKCHFIHIWCSWNRPYPSLLQWECTSTADQSYTHFNSFQQNPYWGQLCEETQP